MWIKTLVLSESVLIKGILKTQLCKEQLKSHPLYKGSVVFSVTIFFIFYDITYSVLVVFGCAGSSLLRKQALSSCSECGQLCYSERASHCGGFSCDRAQALGLWALVVTVFGLLGRPMTHGILPDQGSDLSPHCRQVLNHCTN